MLRALALSLLLLGPAAAAQPLAERLETARTLARVQTALAEDAQLARYVLGASAQGGGVVLSGAVASDADRARAEQVARGVRGVAVVNNTIRVDAQAGRRSGPLPPPIRAAQPEIRPAPSTEVEAMEPAPPSATPSAPQSPPAAPRAAPAPAAETHHTVRSGDTLGAIARQHGVSVQQIQRLNNLRGTTIRPGQRLRVR